METGLQYSPLQTTDANGLQLQDLYAASFNADGQQFSCCSRGCVYIFNTASLNSSIRLYYPSAKPAGILWSGRDTFVCGYRDGAVVTLRLCDVTRTIQVVFLYEPNHRITHLATNTCGSLLATNGDTDIRVWRWDVVADDDEGQWVESRSLPTPFHEHNKPRAIVTGIHWLNHEHLIVSYESHGILLWDAQTGAIIRTVLPFQGHGRLGGISVSNKYRLVVVTRESKFDLYNMDSGALLDSIPHTYNDLSACIVFIHNGACILGAYEDGRVRAWSVDQQEHSKVFTLEHPTSNGRILAIDHHYDPKKDCFMIATVCDTSVTFWSTRNSPQRNRLGSFIATWPSVQVDSLIVFGFIITIATVVFWVYSV